MRLEIKFNQS